MWTIEGPETWTTMDVTFEDLDRVMDKLEEAEGDDTLAVCRVLEDMYDWDPKALTAENIADELKHVMEAAILAFKELVGRDMTDEEIRQMITTAHQQKSA